MRILKMLSVVWLIIPISAWAQHDSVILKNNDVVVGEIKSMSKGVLTIETDYSKSDFTIEWTGIKKIYSKTNFVITLQNRDRYSGSIQTSDDGNKVIINSIDGTTVETMLDQIVYLKGVKSSFWSRAYGSIDLGINLTKANNLRQYSMRSSLGYLSNKWQLDVYYDDIRSSQDSITSTRRTESGISAKYLFRRGWFVFASVDFLSNTEQALDLRTTGKLGGGNFVWQTNKSYWAASGGIASNNESFITEKENRNTMEAFIGSELNLFDIGDLSLFNTIYVYPSLTESGRLRADIILNVSYDLPLDFYIKLGTTVNYDNRPAIEGNETDYVINFSVGWKFNK